MAVYDLEEQDKIAELKSWWSRYGNAVTAVVVVAALAFAGWNGWKWWQGKQATEASALYYAISEGINKNETAKIKDATAQLLERYPSTAYAPRGALLAAKAAFEAGDSAQARTHLEWVIAKAREDELKTMARIRLSAVLLDLKQYDQALAVLDGKHPPAFEGLVLDARGDVFLTQGKYADAKTAYAAALPKLDAKGSLRNYVQLKLDYVSGSVK